MRLNKYTHYFVIEDNEIISDFYALSEGYPSHKGKFIKAKEWMRIGMKLKEVEGELVEDKQAKETKKGFWPFS